MLTSISVVCGPSWLEISVMMAQFPSKAIAELSYDSARWASALPISADC